MKTTCDIYSTVDRGIVEKGFWSCDVEGKKRLVEKELINYTKSKIDQFGFNKYLTENNRSEKLTDLMLCIDDQLETFEEKKDIFEHYTHYILGIVNSIQHFNVVWWLEDDKALIENPRMEQNERGNWESLYTNVKTPPIKTTIFTLYVFNNHFGLNKESHQQSITYCKTKTKSM